MVITITESKMNSVVTKWLDRKYSNLIPRQYSVFIVFDDELGNSVFSYSYEEITIVSPDLQYDLFNMFNESKLCWCNSFIVAKEKVEKLYDFLKQIIIINRYQSEGSERYLGRILLELNDGTPTIDIDGDINLLKNKYDCWNVNPKNDIDSFFVKIIQQKNERTIDR